MKLDPDDDRADLYLLRQGDDSALNRIIGRWEKRLFGFAWRYVRNIADAHDLVAQLFVRLHRQRATLRPESNLGSWLFAVLSNLCHNHYRWRKRHPTVTLEWAGRSSPAAMAAPEAQAGREEASAAVAAAIEELPHDMKVVVLLRYYEDVPLAGIAAAVGCSPRGVETRLYRARQQLRRKLAGGGWI